MKLGDKQRLFGSLLPLLLGYVKVLGFECKIAYCMRCKDCPVGKKNSNHKKQLAIDLDLFKDGAYVTDGEVHTPLGEFWESLHPLCRWGGRFGDGNHYSLEHQGVK